MLPNLKTSFDLKDTSVACAIGPSSTTSSIDFSFQNLVFRIYLNYQQQKSIKKLISLTFWIQILPNKFH